MPDDEDPWPEQSAGKLADWALNTGCAIGCLISIALSLITARLIIEFFRVLLRVIGGSS